MSACGPWWWFVSLRSFCQVKTLTPRRCASMQTTGRLGSIWRFVSEKESCESWFGSSYVGLWLFSWTFHIVPGIIFTFHWDAQSIMFDFKGHLICFHVPQFMFCPYPCRRLSDDSCLRGSNSWQLSFRFFSPGRESKEKRRINFLSLPVEWQVSTRDEYLRGGRKISKSALLMTLRRSALMDGLHNPVENCAKTHLMARR